MNTNELVLTRIKTLLKEKGISYQDVSDATGISKSLIGHMLSGTRVMKPERLVAIAGVLQVSVEDLLAEQAVQHSPLEVVFRGNLTTRTSKRDFDSVLFAIEDYMAMKQVD
ncbi:MULTISPECIES: helix-turn-helix domain-containing protein [unclassified Sporosarcina]|uniref:helix-turn-helix domain-containing protein n=1 Tax=unclassified Sporosarcina TaxID=2647733 RepID=UPI00203C2F7E|nr:MULTISPECIES: helix-turn-helix transcriptional regulator [unclassified Sporosarcina]GKV64825.1 hypothetical protein NCCP2331_09780 [Sporosarcina sp. NCCP-2331]GLB54935.1 hypothetical protein NCCP2378_07200 [Sporosarcina sp. NCCP-2378]